MTQIVTTPLGRFRRMNGGPAASSNTWQFECPICLRWDYLDGEQWVGRSKVYCNDGATACHDYGAALAAGLEGTPVVG